MSYASAHDPDSSSGSSSGSSYVPGVHPIPPTEPGIASDEDLFGFPATVRYPNAFDAGVLDGDQRATWVGEERYVTTIQVTLAEARGSVTVRKGPHGTWVIDAEFHGRVVPGPGLEGAYVSVGAVVISTQGHATFLHAYEVDCSRGCISATGADDTPLETWSFHGSMPKSAGFPADVHFGVGSMGDISNEVENVYTGEGGQGGSGVSFIHGGYDVRLLL
jgi:hypothetical protein